MRPVEAFRFVTTRQPQEDDDAVRLGCETDRFITQRVVILACPQLIPGRKSDVHSITTDEQIASRASSGEMPTRRHSTHSGA